MAGRLVVIYSQHGVVVVDGETIDVVYVCLVAVKNQPVVAGSQSADSHHLEPAVLIGLLSQFVEIEGCHRLATQGFIGLHLQFCKFGVAL